VKFIEEMRYKIILDIEILSLASPVQMI